MQSFHGYPLVIRTGGLLNALGPEVGKKTVHPKTGQVTIHCPGFNRKNKYDRQTPCDQDFLRKIARETEADKLVVWFNTQMPQLLERERLFDPEGIFIGDASYIFVPDNENYQNSDVLLFDEHNHPVEKEKLSSSQLRGCRYRRCYKWVELIHTNASGEFFFFVAMHLGRGKSPHGNHIVVYANQYYGFFDIPEYTEIVMTIVEPGKSKLLRKVRRIRRDFLRGLNWPRGP